MRTFKGSQMSHLFPTRILKWIHSIMLIDDLLWLIFRRQKLIYHLNSSGKYFAFKEQLKHAVVKIVREKYARTTNFDNKDELQVNKTTFHCPQKELSMDIELFGPLVLVYLQQD